MFNSSRSWKAFQGIGEKEYELLQNSLLEKEIPFIHSTPERTPKRITPGGKYPLDTLKNIHPTSLRWAHLLELSQPPLSIISKALPRLAEIWQRALLLPGHLDLSPIATICVLQLRKSRD